MASPERGSFEKTVDRVGKVELVGGIALAVVGVGVGVPIALFGVGKLAALKFWDDRKKK